MNLKTSRLDVWTIRVWRGGLRFNLSSTAAPVKPDIFWFEHRRFHERFSDPTVDVREHGVHLAATRSFRSAPMMCIEYTIPRRVKQGVRERLACPTRCVGTMEARSASKYDYALARQFCDDSINCFGYGVREPLLPENAAPSLTIQAILSPLHSGRGIFC